MKNYATLAQQEFVAKQLRRRRMVTSARASADFGRLFSITRYGSRISDRLLLDQRATAPN